MDLHELIDEGYLLLDELQSDLEGVEDEFEQYELEEEIAHVISVIEMQEATLLSKAQQDKELK